MTRFVVGLTGGIGSGKSTVARAFQELGIDVVDTDAIAHEITRREGPAIAALRKAFGDGVFAADGELDRAALRGRVFSDATARARLESILHPLIRQIARARIAAATSPYVLTVVPLLVEKEGFGELVDRVLVVDCDEATQIERVMRRSGLSESDVRAIMATQASRGQRLARAHDVIDNDAEVVNIVQQVKVLDARYRELAAARSATARGHD